jgi:hypothetical protein
VFAVTAGVQLAGMTEDAFKTDAMRTAFNTATASSLGISPSAVDITGVSTVAAGRRRLTQSTALQVDYQVYMLSAAAASSVSTKIAATGGVSVAALQSAGVPVTGVVLTTAPVLTALPAPPAPPAPPPPPPTPPPPAGCGSLWFCHAGVACTSVSTCAPCPVGMAGDGRNCTGCTLHVALTSNVAGGASPRSSEATLSGVVSAAEQACTTAGGFSFSWSTNATDAASLSLSTTPTLTLPARSLSAGQTAAFSLQACFAGAPTTCGLATQAFFITASPLVALLGGGGGVVGETPLSLSAASSYDPDGAPLSSLGFAWTCTRVDTSDSACVARDGTVAALGSAAVQRLQLAGTAGGAHYVVGLTVSQSGRSASTNTSLTVLPGAIPLVAVAGSAALSGAKVNPTQQQVLFAVASSTIPGGVTTRWTLAAQSGVVGPLLNLSDPAVCATPVTSASMVLRPEALVPGARYTFQLSATDTVGAVGLANATLITSTPPRDGWADVSPASGVALSTKSCLEPPAGPLTPTSCR